MFRIDRAANKIQPLKRRSFGELGFRERQHLQEWIAAHPECLGEPLLIIQKEFAGFSDTSERLDLLAIDKEGRLVVIENKLDDSGRDVTWQAMKYASYCSNLDTEGIVRIYQDYLAQCRRSESSEQLIAEFLEVDDLSEVALNRSVTQRIILVAASFRKEVTSTVLWLLNYRLQIACFKVTPFALGDEVFLSFEQVIPTPDTEEFMINVADKAQAEVTAKAMEGRRYKIRMRFWGQFLERIQADPKTALYQNVSPSRDNWLATGTGVGNVQFNVMVTQSYCRALVYFNGPEAENTWYFERLKTQRDAIEKDFGAQLEWESMEGRIGARIQYETAGNIFDEEQWPEMIDFLHRNILRIETTFRERVHALAAELRRAKANGELAAETAAAD